VRKLFANSLRTFDNEIPTHRASSAITRSDIIYRSRMLRFLINQDTMK